ncbi:MAG: hypothetical protein DMG76_26785 [Acidobacteria bacterium]|nr:MAG: hypothetical protein DMG76_26785 [Acidobacteriota bacterium]
MTALDGIFADLDKATAAEIQMIAIGLSVFSAPNPPSLPIRRESKQLQTKAQRGIWRGFG